MNDEMNLNEEQVADMPLGDTNASCECSFLPPEELAKEDVAVDYAAAIIQPESLSPYVFDKDEKKKAKKIVSRSFLGIFIYWLIIQGVFTVCWYASLYVAKTFFGDVGFDFVYSGAFSLLLQLLCYAIALPIFLAITKNIPKATTQKKNRLPFGQFMLLMLISWAVMILGSYISSLTDLAMTLIYGTPVDNAVDSMISNTPIWLVMLVVVVVGPIVEELIFRKVLIDRLSIFGDRTAILISAIAFGLFHGNLSQLFYAALVGLVFGYVYARTRRIWNSIFLHMIVNFLGSVIPMIGKWAQGNIDRLGDDMSILTAEEQTLYSLSSALSLSTSAIQGGVFIAGLVFLIIFLAKRKFKVSHSCEMPIPRKSRAGVYLCNAGVILFLVICAIQIAASLGMNILL